ncbi:leucine-rich repeat protein [Tanacetum coccineum]
MRGNKISGILPDSLMNLTKLEMLQLGRNELVGRIPSWLGINLPSLRLLNFRSNSFDGNIPHQLCYLTTVQILDLADNHLSGNIPRCFHNFTVLSGKENISTDEFSFYIVYCGATIASDLLNKLYGELPMSLSGLNSLSSFNVSYNNLTGRVPSSTQLQSLNESSFFGNNLCGAPLTECCAVKVPDMKDKDQDDGSHGTDWGLIVSTVFGLIAGFWIVITPLIVSRSCRIA